MGRTASQLKWRSRAKFNPQPAGGLGHPKPQRRPDERIRWRECAGGSVFTPRIGTEVAVQFIEGDIDRPLVVGALARSDHLPPFSAGHDAGVNHPGVLSGWQSQGLDGSDSNQWVSDDATGQLPAFAQAAIVLDSAAALAQTSSAGSITHSAGQRMALSAQGDVQATAAHTWAQVAGTTASVYAHQGGLQVKAANGPVSLRAHTDDLKLLADQSVTLTSVNDEIRISANSKIELIAGQSGITLEGGNITVTTPGRFAVKGATHGFLGGGSQAASLPLLPAGSAAHMQEERFILKNQDTGEPLADWPYELSLFDGSVARARTDGDGNTHLVVTANAESIEVEALPNDALRLILDGGYWNDPNTSGEATPLDFAKQPDGTELDD